MTARFPTAGRTGHRCRKGVWKFAIAVVSAALAAAGLASPSSSHS